MAYFRLPATQSERRKQNDDGGWDGEVKFRVRDLPTSWSDIPKSKTRSWKKNRKTKYRMKGVS